MSETGFAPESEEYLSLEQANDPNIEIVFVQHSPAISTEQAKEAYKQFLKNSTASNITITPLPSQTPVYPISFGNNELHTTRKVDKFLILTPTQSA